MLPQTKELMDLLKLNQLERVALETLIKAERHDAVAQRLRDELAAEEE